MDSIIDIKNLINELKTMSRDNPDRKIKLQKAIELYANYLLPEVKTIVKNIEAKPETTQGHYGEYLRILTGLKGFNLFAMSRALVLAGASQEGLQGANMILNQ